MVVPDMGEFVSPIDGSVVRGRVQFNEHCRRHNVTNVADFNQPGGQWDRQRQEREKFYTGGQGYDRERRIEHIKRAFEKHSRRS